MFKTQAVLLAFHEYPVMHTQKYFPSAAIHVPSLLASDQYFVTHNTSALAFGTQSKSFGSFGFFHWYQEMHWQFPFSPVGLEFRPQTFPVTVDAGGGDVKVVAGTVQVDEVFSFSSRKGSIRSSSGSMKHERAAKGSTGLLANLLMVSLQ